MPDPYTYRDICIKCFLANKKIICTFTHGERWYNFVYTLLCFNAYFCFVNNNKGISFRYSYDDFSTWSYLYPQSWILGLIYFYIGRETNERFLHVLLFVVSANVFGKKIISCIFKAAGGTLCSSVFDHYLITIFERWGW